jgi:putative transposase
MRVVLAQMQAGDRAAVADALYAVFVASRRKAVEAAMSAVEVGPWGERYSQLVAQWRALVSQWAPFFALPALQRSLVLAGDRMAAQLHKGLVRAIVRHGPFIDSAAALRFVAVVLHRAGHRLDRERAEFVAAGCEPRGVALGRLAMASEPRG